MNNEDEYYENDLASIIVDCCYHIHVNLGPGLLESVYEEILYSELTEIGLRLKDKSNYQLFGKVEL